MNDWDFDSFWLLFLAGLCALVSLIFIVPYIVYLSLSEPEWQSEAIERGYALHCPKNGKFAWQGECDVSTTREN